MPTPAQAVRDIHTTFKTVWDAFEYGSAPFYNAFYPGIDCGPRPTTQVPWAEVSLQHVAGGPISISGGLGQSIEEAIGIYQVAIYTPLGRMDWYDTLYRPILNAFRAGTTTNGVRFRNAHLNEVGSTGDFFRMNIRAEFEYDEVI